MDLPKVGKCDAAPGRAGMRGVGVKRSTVKTVIGAFVASCVTLASASAAYALPEGRHYEMISPLYKAGYGVRLIEAISPDGNSLIFTSLGAFAGAPSNHIGFATGSAYLAKREADQWVTTPAMLPATVAPYETPGDFSATLSEAFFYGQPGPDMGWAQFEHTESDFFLHSLSAPPTSNFEVAGESLPVPPRFINYVGASLDLSHIVLSSDVGLTPGVAEATGGLYDLVTRPNNGDILRFIGLDNDSPPKAIAQSCDLVLGGQEGAIKSSTFYSVSADGSEIFFTTCVGGSKRPQLYVRLAGKRTLEISRPLESGPFGGCVGELESKAVPGEVPCRGASTRRAAEYVGASSDGSRVFFMTEEPLVGTDTDTGKDLYMATIGCSQTPNCATSEKEVTGLEQVSQGAASQGARMQGAVALSADGSHIYFVALGVLTGENQAKAAPISGADNLYVYDSATQSLGFVADLCTGPLESGPEGSQVEDNRCPVTFSNTQDDKSLWLSNEPEAQTTQNGDVFIFTSYGQLTADDTDDARDVYRYDAEDGTLKRVSDGENGYDANGNRDDKAGTMNNDAGIAPTKISEPHSAVQAELGLRTITDDGSRVVFTSAGALSSSATNGLVNAYEWHAGKVALVSTGSDEQPVEDVVITPLGQDLFFLTVQGLSAQDTDGAGDVYDARTGAGFPTPPVARRECESDACQGPLSEPAAVLIPDSALPGAGEVIASPRRHTRHKKLKRHKRRRHGRRGTKRPRASRGR